jgi:hypothetical protein
MVFIRKQYFDAWRVIVGYISRKKWLPNRNMTHWIGENMTIET